jgi:hypothetical protein
VSKRFNTILFIIGAAAVNVVLILALAVAGLVSLFSLARLFKAGDMDMSLPVVAVFVAALAIDAVAYRAIMKLLRKRIDFDAHFEPIFPGSRKDLRR